MGALDKIIRQGATKVRGGRDLPMDPASRMERAIEGGYNIPGVHLGVVHNTDQLPEIQQSPRAKYYQQFTRFQPFEHTHRGGSYFALPGRDGSMKDTYEAARMGLQKQWWRGVDEDGQPYNSSGYMDTDSTGTMPSGTSYPVLLRDRIFGRSTVPENSPLLDIAPSRVDPVFDPGTYSRRDPDFEDQFQRRFNEALPREVIRERAELLRARSMASSPLEARRYAEQELREAASPIAEMLYNYHYHPDRGHFMMTPRVSEQRRRDIEPMPWGSAEYRAGQASKSGFGSRGRFASPGQRSAVGDALNWMGYDGSLVGDEAFNRGLTDSAYVWNPSAIRSRFAKFDPANFHRAGLTLGVAAPVAGGALSQIDRREMEDDGGRR